MTPISIEQIFGGLTSFATAALWYWVKGVADRLKESDRRADELRNELHQVRLDYKTKAEARAERETVAKQLDRIEDKLDKLAERKADK